MSIKYTERFNKLWHIYDNDLAHGKKGSKFTAFNAFEKYKEDEQERIILDTVALMRHFKQQTQPDRIPHFSTWLNQRYFDQPIPSATEKVQVEYRTCSQCENQVHGGSFEYCADHVPSKWDEPLRAAWKETGLNRNSPTLREDCREYITKLGYGKMVGGK